MSNSSVNDCLDEYFRRTWPKCSVGLDMDLFDSGLMNSLRAMHLIRHIERSLHFTFHSTYITRETFSSRRKLEAVISAQQGGS